MTSSVVDTNEAQRRGSDIETSDHKTDGGPGRWKGVVAGLGSGETQHALLAALSLHRAPFPYRALQGR